MIGENPLTAADLDVVGALSPTLIPPMTKLFRQLCDREQSHIVKSTKALQLVPDRPLHPEQEPQEAVVGWPPTRDVAGNPTDQYEVDYIMDQRGRGDEAHYLVRWRGAPLDRATYEPVSHLGGCPELLRAWRRRQRNRRSSAGGATRPTTWSGGGEPLWTVPPRNPLAIWGVALNCYAPGGAVSGTAVRPDPPPSPRFGTPHLPLWPAAARFLPCGGGGKGVQEHPMWR
ncbi:hypothetical protein EPH_0002560 [Eimeria praecox]|uniref:Chromo domain-containing protein n=1 Tax=Eimeria praecox TaxID=51316 RepID=U6G2S8_9EIME|nr:hypothetical protein EPH_0002560 [Eimeria praecox]